MIRYIIYEYEYDDLNWDDPINISVAVLEWNQVLNMICIVNQYHFIWNTLKNLFSSWWWVRIAYLIDTMNFWYFLHSLFEQKMIYS